MLPRLYCTGPPIQDLPLPNRVKRDGIEIGRTIGKHGYFTDYDLSPNTTYTYAVEGLAAYGAIIWHSNPIQITTTSSSTIKTKYSLLAIVFNPGGALQSDMDHIRTFLDYRLDFLK
jgi:hypothetical protein